MTILILLNRLASLPYGEDMATITMKEIESQSEITEQSKKLTGEYLILVEHGKKYEMYV